MIITVKAARVNCGLTQKQVANKLNISLTAYIRKENGKTNFYAHEIVLLGNLFSVPITNFFEVACPKKTQSA